MTMPAIPFRIPSLAWLRGPLALAAFAAALALSTGHALVAQMEDAYASVVYKVPYKLGDFEATACLLFDRNTFLFREVMIPLPDPSRRRHVADLITANYGPPSGTSDLMGDIITQTVWLAEKDRIIMRNGPDFATLVFSRPVSDTGEGW